MFRKANITLVRVLFLALHSCELPVASRGVTGRLGHRETLLDTRYVRNVHSYYEIAFYLFQYIWYYVSWFRRALTATSRPEVGT
jgi:hypothetical protein